MIIIAASCGDRQDNITLIFKELESVADEDILKEFKAMPLEQAIHRGNEIFIKPLDEIIKDKQKKSLVQHYFDENHLDTMSFFTFCVVKAHFHEYLNDKEIDINEIKAFVSEHQYDNPPRATKVPSNNSDKATNTLEGLIARIESELHPLGFKTAQELMESPISERIFKNGGYLDEYKYALVNDDHEKISVLAYMYQDKESSLGIFNELVNSNMRHAILKPGAAVMLHSNSIVCIVGACSLDKKMWNEVLDKMRFEIPSLLCSCGVGCKTHLIQQ